MKLRGDILTTDHLRGKQALRTDYSEFERPTLCRRWAQKARDNRARLANLLEANRG